MQVVEHTRQALLTIPLLSVITTGAEVHAQDTRLALTNVTVIDGTGAPPMPTMTLVIVRDRIADIFPTGAKPLPANTAVGI